MLGDISVADEIYIVCGYTDMRRSIDGLCAIVQDRLHMDPRQRALYLFCGKRCDCLKALRKRMLQQTYFSKKRDLLSLANRVLLFT